MADEGMPRKATNLSELRAVCKPKPLTGQWLHAFFVETYQARDPHQKTRERLLMSLNAGENVRILFYGHRGCGKSTELSKFLDEQAHAFLPVKFSVLEELNPVAACAEDLILVIAERLLATAQAEKLPVDRALLEPVQRYFATITAREASSAQASVSASVGVDLERTWLGKLLGLVAKVRTDAKLGASSETTAVAQLRKRPGDLLDHANRIIEAIRPVLPDGRRLLVVVEDMDKLGVKQAREIYVDNVALLTGLRTNIIYTIPMFLFYSPDVGTFRPYFDDAVPLPMIKVAEPSGLSAAGMKAVRDVVLSRLEPGLIQDDALDLLIKKTGGVLRHAFEVLHHVACMSDIAEPITPDHVRYGLDRLRKELWDQIALPPEPMPNPPESVNELFNRLTDYARQQRGGKRPLPMSDTVNQLLLRACALVEYNGEGWLGVHPLVVENLERLGRLE